MTSGPVRVTILGHTGQLGGAELALVRLCAELQKYDVHIRVLLFADGPLVGALRNSGVDVEVLPLAEDIAHLDRASVGRLVLDNVWRAARVLPFLVRLTRYLARSRPDVVHSTTLKTHVLSALPAKVLRRPLVWQLHDRVADDYLPATVAAMLRFVARFVPRAIIANSHATALTLGTAARRAVVAYPGFAPDQQVSWDAVRAVPSSPVVGLIGRVSLTKGQRELVRAAPRILEEFPLARFVVVGAPMFGAQDYEREVKAEADQLGIADAFTWVGFAKNVAAQIDQLTVLVHASPVPEPFGQVVVEAMIRGVPVVATRAGGVAEILQPACAQDRETLGVLVEPGDPDDLAQGILTVLRDPAGARSRAACAYRSASERFPIAESARMVAGAWQALAKPRPGDR